MKIAYCCVKPSVEARFESFCTGLAAAGYRVVTAEPRQPAQVGDVLVTWNKKGPWEAVADRFERQGGTVIVAENGYLGKDESGHQYYAIARHGHNGSGEWVSGGGERFERLGVDLKPWRASGSHILVCPNRFIGPKAFLMPQDWVERTVAELQLLTDRPIRVRPHPGHWKRLKQHPDIGLATDMAGAFACVIWASSAGVKALMWGIPVICTAPWWICKQAAGSKLSEINSPPMPDRLPAFERMSWAQWTMKEIEAGIPFCHLLDQRAEAA